MKRSLWLLVASIIGIIAIFLIFHQRYYRNSDNQKITIAQFGDFFLYAPLYIAIDAGFFEQQKVDVSLISTGGDDKTWAAVVSGDASFGVADPTFVAVAAARGTPGKVIASIVNGVPFWGITFDKNIHPIVNNADLKPYTVATFPSPSTAFSLQTKMFKDAGLEPHIREGSFGTLIPMLRAGEAQIALELEPNVSLALTQGAHILYSMKELYGDFAITGLTASPQLLTENPALVQKVLCSLQMALDFLRKQPDESLSLLSKRFPEVKLDIASNALQRVTKEKIIPENLIITKDAWNNAINLRLSIGDISTVKSIETYVDNSFATEAAATCRIK